MRSKRDGPRLAGAGVFLAVFLVDVFGVWLAAAQNHASVIWPAAGIAVAAVVACGGGAVKVVFPAALAANFIGGLVFWRFGLVPNIALAATAAACQSGAAWVIVAWMRRSCGGEMVFRDGRHFLRFVAGVATASLVSAGIRTGVAVAIGPMTWRMLGEVWLMHGIGDFVGILIFASLALARGRRDASLSRWRTLEAVVLLILLLLAANAMNGAVPHVANLGFPGVFLVVAVVFWIAFRLGMPELSIALLVLATMNFAGAMNGQVAFPGRTVNESIFDLLSFLALISTISLGFVAVLEERDEHVAKLHRLNENLEGKISARTRQLEQINQELTDAVSIVAHDVRGPVSGIRTLARHMRWAGLDLSAAEGDELLGEIERTSAEAVEMMGRLLDLQRANHRAVGLVPADVGRLVAGMCRHYEIAAQEKGVSLRVIRPGREMMHLVDTDGIKFIISNLVSNALKFLPSGGTVEVRVSEGFSGCMLVVSDNGPGIADRELPGLFNRFAKAANRPTAGESSSGLGLFIVRKLVLAMDGTLYVESAPGEGAAFVVEWPAEAIRTEPEAV